MNAEELAQNQQLTEFVVKDLNKAGKSAEIMAKTWRYFASLGLAVQSNVRMFCWKI